MAAPTGSPAVDRLRRARAAIDREIASTCSRSGRAPGEVRVLPATKGRPVEYLDALRAAGFERFGESRIGEFARKRRARPELQWEFIGRFRPEDAPLLARSTQLVHSVADVDQLRALDVAAAAAGVRCPVLLQLNLGGDPHKQGFAAEADPADLLTAPGDHLVLRGIMVLGPAGLDAEGTDVLFRRGRAVFDALRNAGGPLIDTLSMGMSGDYSAAVRAGATVVRIGTLFASAWAGPDPPAAGPR